jgi:hypothetical protein
LSTGGLRRAGYPQARYTRLTVTGVPLAVIVVA